MRRIELEERELPTTVRTAGQLLHNAGWEEIGTGYHVTVYGKAGNDYVVKIFEGDRAYIDFLKLVKAHPNKHFPKIRGRQFISGRLVGVRMEKLFPMPKINLGGTTISAQSLMDIYLIEKDFPLDGYQKTLKEMAQEYLRDKPELVIALDLIHEHLLGEHVNDIHSENVMMRRDGTPVLTDPVG